MNFVKLRPNSLFYVKLLFEFNCQIFNPNLVQTIIWLKTIDVILFIGQNLTMKISSNCIVILYFTWNYFWISSSNKHKPGSNNHLTKKQLMWFRLGQNIIMKILSNCFVIPYFTWNYFWISLSNFKPKPGSNNHLT